MSDSSFRTSPDEEWADLMRQLQDQPQAQPRPFFYNRVTAQLSSRATAHRRGLPVWMLRPAYAALLGVIMLALSGDASALRVAPDVPSESSADFGQPQTPSPH
ncbi:hypothetical protein I2I05_05430 [Hymenobacter sp. BT683]|uniref:DUF3379 domain-containing protein n=1 Tax=Hymenobacter jeongseonensis TaxID=2791027 RepID=A0ABS0IEP8_9BACT|nr:hypothetical protein [Hymenobacter jeongseonensis]MBF9236831.1 hypothetical protein [Hymenobacter jeongseonensis]